MTERLVQSVAVAIAAAVLVMVVVTSRAHRNESSTARAQEIMQGVAAAMTSPTSYGVTSAVLKTVGSVGVALGPNQTLRLPDPDAGISESTIWEGQAGQRVESRLQTPRVFPGGNALDTNLFTIVSAGSRRWTYVMHVAIRNDNPDYGFVRISDLPQPPPLMAIAFPLARCYPSPRFEGTGRTVAGRPTFILDVGRSTCAATVDADLLGAGGRYDRYIWVDVETYFILKDELHDARGNVVSGTTHQVTSIDYNVPIPAERLTFEVPPYATVIDCTGAAAQRPKGC